MGYNLTQINPAYELVSDIVVGTATTSVDFTGLNITKEDDYILVSDIKNTSSSCSYTLFVNGNNTATNYYYEQLYAYTTVVGGVRANSSRICFAATGNRALSISKIKLTNNGYFVFQSKFNQNYVGSGIEIGETSNTSTFTATNITSLRVNAETSNQIDVSSRFQLYKRVAPIVFDYEVTGSAVTQIDITGLNIDKTGEYQLVSTITYNSIPSAYFLYANNNNTITNYYNQFLQVGNTSATSSRSNSATFLSNIAVGQVFGISNIKLTNNGYFTNTNEGIVAFGSSSVQLIKLNGSSTFTSTSLASLSIVSSATNGIGIGSRFQLIKLK